MQIVGNSIMHPSELVLLGFKEVRNKTPDEVAYLLFERSKDVRSVVLTDFNDEMHIFFIEQEQQHLTYFRAFNESLDRILFSEKFN